MNQKYITINLILIIVVGLSVSTILWINQDNIRQATAAIIDNILQWGKPINVISCKGRVIGNLCYTGVYNQEIGDVALPSYEDNKIRINVAYDLNTPIDSYFDFKISVFNKQNDDLTLYYNAKKPDDQAYSLTAINDFEGSTATEKVRMIELKSYETKVLSGTAKSLVENGVFGKLASYSFFHFNFGYDNEMSKFLYLQSNVPYTEGIKCGEKIFPETFNICSLSGYFCGDVDRFLNYDRARCCNNVFYPNAECCKNSDCDKGICVDGKCIKKTDWQSGIGFDPLVGNKKIIVMDVSNDAPGSLKAKCKSHNSIHENTYTAIETFYDGMAKKYLGRNKNFINFQFETYGPFNRTDLGIEINSESKRQIAERIGELCKLNLSKYHEIVLNSQIIDTRAAGTAGKPLLINGLDNDRTINSFAHELGHNFGCYDLYNMSGVFQLAGTLFGRYRSFLLQNESLDLCRGELGWVDSDKNGILDVNEFKYKSDYYWR